MVLLRDRQFVHLPNHDGTTDSICKYCFGTVCTSIWETELAQAEREHLCDPRGVARWQELQESDARTMEPTGHGH